MRQEINPYRFNPEESFEGRFSLKEAPLTSEEEYVYENLPKKLKEFIPDERNFSDIYKMEEILKDKAKIRTISRDQFYKTQRAELCEAILGTGIGEFDWFGQEANVNYASKFDDVSHATDFIVEFEGEDGEIQLLGVDTTLSEKEDAIKKKIDNIFKTIDKQTLGRLKYYDSELHPELRGGVEMMPWVIVKINKSEIPRLSKLVKNHLMKEKGSSNELATDSIQLGVIEEIKAQLEAQLYYAIYRFFFSIAKKINQLDKSKAQELSAFSQIWEKRNTAELLDFLANNKEIFSIDKNFNPEVIEKLYKIFITFRNLFESKKEELNLQEMKSWSDKGINYALEQWNEKEETFNFSPHLFH